MVMDPGLRSSPWRRVETLLLGLLLLAPLVGDPWGMLASQYKAAYIHLTAGLLLTAFLFRASIKTGFCFTPSWTDLPWGLFMGLAALSLLWSLNIPVNLQRLVLLASVTLCFLLIRIRIVEGDPPINYVAFLVFTGTLVALIDSAGIFLNRSGGVGDLPFKSSTILFPHNNVASLYTIVPVCLAYSLLFCYREPWKKGLSLFALLALGGHLYFLESRAAWVESGFGLAIITLAMLFRERLVLPVRTIGLILERKAVLFFLVALVVVVFLLPLSPEVSAWGKAAFMKAVNLFDLDFQRTFFRLDIWRKTMAMVSDHLWFGVGLGNFPVILPVYHKLEITKSHPHNEYFNVLVELGIVGMVFYVFFLILLFRAFIRGFLAPDESGMTRRLTIGVGSALLIEAFHGFVEPPMIFEASILNMMVCSGFLVSFEGFSRGGRILKVGPGRKAGRYALPLLACIGMGLALPGLLSAFRQGLDLKQGRQAYENLHYQEAETIFRQLNRDAWEGYYPHLLIGDACLYQGKNEEAYAEYQKAEALRPYQFDIHYRKGVVLKRMKRYEEALVSLEKTLQYNPGHRFATMERIKVLVELKKYGRASRYLEVYIRSRKPSLEDLVISGKLFFRIYEEYGEDGERSLKALNLALDCFEKAREMGADVAGDIDRIRLILKRPSEE